MRLYIATVVTALSLSLSAAPAYATSCYDLWYERNQIYDSHGFCFKTHLGISTFDNSDCYTSHPKLAKWEKKRVAEIQYEEEAKYCHVNE